MNVGDKISFKAGFYSEVRTGVIISIDRTTGGAINVEKLYTVYDPSCDSYGLVLPSMVIDILEYASSDNYNDAYERAMSVL